MFELLETRTLMSASLANGTLTLTETNNADTIVVGKNAAGQLFVTENNVTSNFTWNAVSKVVANLLAGADKFTAQSAVNKPMEVHGGDGNDTIVTGSGNDSLFGDNDNDLLDGAGGDDDTHGGAGIDTADFSNRTNNLNISLDDVANDGGIGAHDNIHTDIEVVLGGYGNDIITGDDANNTLTGSGGNDTLEGMGGDDWLDGGVGGVAVYAQNTGNDLLYGGDGNDTLHASDYGNCTLYGEAGNDYLHGWGGNDYLSGGDGNDTEYGGAGDDVIYGNAGNDYLYGEDGNDNINGDNGNSVFINVSQYANVKFVAAKPLTIFPVTGPRLIAGATTLVGPHLISAGALPLTSVSTSSLNTSLLTTTKTITSISQFPINNWPIFTITTYNDFISGGNGNDTVRGNVGNDTVHGDAGNDRVYGDDGNDSCYGDDGADSVYGGAGNDFSSGGNGDDVLVAIGGGTADSVRGDAGRDEFWVDNSPTEIVQDADFFGESLAGTVHYVGTFANGASKELNGQNLTDPDFSDNRTPYTPDVKNFSTHPLFADSGPNQNDIVQGQVGDCYFLAGLSSTARVDPQRIKNSVVDLGDGTYAVEFYTGSAWSFYRVDGDLATYNGTSSLYYANYGASQSIWVPIMEKAFADFRSGSNSYNSLHGGGTNEPFTDLGGSPANVWDSTSQNNTLLNINNALLAGKAVDANTPNSNPTNGCPAVKWHVYSVVSVQTTKITLPFGITLEIATGITLRNPWGYDGGGSTDSNTSDGYVTVTASQFYGYFTGASASYM
jgi:Ca2+-binding RTX toxin-like protein